MKKPNKIDENGSVRDESIKMEPWGRLGASWATSEHQVGSRTLSAIRPHSLLEAFGPKMLLREAILGPPLGRAGGPKSQFLVKIKIKSPKSPQKRWKKNDRFAPPPGDQIDQFSQVFALPGLVFLRKALAGLPIFGKPFFYQKSGIFRILAKNWPSFGLIFHPKWSLGHQKVDFESSGHDFGMRRKCVVFWIAPWPLKNQ